MFFSFNINASQSNILPINLAFQKKKHKFEFLNVFERLEQAQKEKNANKKHKNKKIRKKHIEKNTYQKKQEQVTYNDSQQIVRNENTDTNNQEQQNNNQVQSSDNQQNEQINNQTQQNNNSTQNSSAKQEIANAESTNNYNATNGRYYGKYQLDISYLNGDLSPENQDRTFDKYVTERYGSVENALEFRKVHNWY